jgi:hypothetical protein
MVRRQMAHPNVPSTGSRLLMLAGVCTALIIAFVVVVRPWYQHWGASDEEAWRTLPGDQIVVDAVTQQTRAITIDAPADRVWAWLAQIGQDRSGFYSFDSLQNLIGCRMPAGEDLRPDLQQWRVGQRLWMCSPDEAGGAGFATLRVLEPGRVLGFGTHASFSSPNSSDDGSWTFELEPIDKSQTRLYVRSRAAGGRQLLGARFDSSTFEPLHFVMERRMMVGLKQLAETGQRSQTNNDLQVLLWALSFLLVIAGVERVMHRTHPGRALVALAAAGIVFQVLTLGQPAPWVGADLLSGVLVFLLWV